ncbi:MAG: O-acetylhomoserine aminocarboxypropyltransferase/cysteine synthase [Clostridia bacterium]|nr:O-acetylhomoserine aminocarboxypropyltransferase/cysteine synthase [Clostridia bacterium]
MHVDSKCLHAGYAPKNGEPNALPIYQSTTYRYDSTEHIGRLFDLKEEGHMYSRISNPTVAAVEAKIAALEGGVAAVCTTSGMAATLLTVLNICKTGDHIVASAEIYGGTINLLSFTLKRYGIDVTFIPVSSTKDEIKAAIKENTRMVFGETIANPAISVLDIEVFAEAAHECGIPLVIDNTFATPILCRPFEWGADIVIHSTSKYMDGHATVVGGVVVDGGKFDWENGKFPELCEPDVSYHGVSYTKQFGAAAFATKARCQLVRDMGIAPSAMDAFLLDLGLQSLAVRVERHCRNAEACAEYFENHPMVEFVNYPTLKSNKYYDLAQKYLPKGASGVIGFSIKGSRDNAIKFMDSLQLAINAVHVADARTMVLHPASETHRQLNDEQLIAAGITPGLVRFSVGIENIEDILADVKQAFDAI